MVGRGSELAGPSRVTVLGELDINLVFTLGVRLKGSIRQTVGTLNIRASSQAKGQPSLRALFHM